MKKLIVTADDFGAAREVNDAVEIAHRDGILTAASLMVAAPAAFDAAQRAKRMPNLHVGLHLVLVEGRPVLPPRAIPDLVGRDGMLRTDMAAMGVDIFLRPSVRHQLEGEINAQFDAFQAMGLKLDHVNAHKHYQLHPTIASIIVRVGRSFGMQSARVPYEPRAVLSRIERGGDNGLAAIVMAPWSMLLRRRLRADHLAVPDRVFGLRWSGAMTKPRLLGLLRHLPKKGVSEIYLHPATGPYLGSVATYRYAEELAALTDPEVVAAARDSNIRLGGFADFR